MAKILRPVCLMVILALVLSLGVALAPQAMAKVGGGGPGTITVTNGIYTLSVEDTPSGSGIGTYTVSTGASHPNPNQDVLFDGAAHSPWSTYLTVRVYSAAAAGTEYVSTSSSPTPSAGFAVVNLDDCSPVVTQVGNTITTTWTAKQGLLLITQVTAIEGTTLADSRVRVTTTVTNEAFGEVGYLVGIRYEWDLMIDGVDEAWFKEINPDGAWSDTEIAYAPPAFERFETTNDPTAPMFSVFGTVNGPTTFTPAPTPPDRFVYASWSGANGNAFDYTPVPLSGMDSAVLYYWGNSSGNAIELLTGESVSVTQYIYTGCPPPEADFTATPTKGSAPLTVQFTDLSYDDITSWLWHFGDGETSTAQNPSHVYNYAGTYPVTLTVANSCGTDVATDYIEVIEEVAPARLIVRNLQIQPAQAYPGDSVTITADVVNQGGIRGSKDIDLVINGQAEQSTRVGVDPGAAQHITFTTSKTAPGTYEVYIEGQASAFNVLLRPHVTSTAGASGGLDTGAIIAIVVIAVIFLVGIIIVFIRIRR